MLACWFGMARNDILCAGFKKTRFFKKLNPGFFGGVLGFFLDKQEKIGKIIQNSVT